MTEHHRAIFPSVSLFFLLFFLSFCTKYSLTSSRESKIKILHKFNLWNKILNNNNKKIQVLLVLVFWGARNKTQGRRKEEKPNPPNIFLLLCCSLEKTRVPNAVVAYNAKHSSAHSKSATFQPPETASFLFSSLFFSSSPPSFLIDWTLLLFLIGFFFIHFLHFHSPVLKPDFDLAFSEIKDSGYFVPPVPCKVHIE